MNTTITATQNDDVLLEVKNLRTYFKLPRNKLVKAVDDISFTLHKGKVLGIIGESGSGKSVTSRSILRIVEEPGYIAGGEILFKGVDCLKLSEKAMNALRGKEISLIFQDPTTSFNPYMTMGQHLEEAYRVHKAASKDTIRKRSLDVLKMVGINDGENVLPKYPCEFSAGFRQRIFIAMAMIFNPDLLIADEPTTSLGITIQAEIIEALNDVKRASGTSIIIITHDFGVVSQFSDDIFVMYAGHCVEFSPKRDLLLSPMHPYTVGLIRSVPLLEARKTRRLKSIPGFPPDMTALPDGCPFAERCEYAKDVCFKERPELLDVGNGRFCACHYPLKQYRTSDETVLEV
ncbi:MAG: ABC transporter ATP-binding protein [Clostridiaceae bacterium]|nr:ABC transporter ATP-binding protein [Clostridiaceae bacterium]